MEDGENLVKFLKHGIYHKGEDPESLSGYEKLIELYYGLYEEELKERELSIKDLLDNDPRFVYYLKVQYLITRRILP